jgi:hypothetical protein
MRPVPLLRRVLVLLAVVLVLLVAAPGAALACGISYEDTPGSPSSGCSAAAAVTGITVVGVAAAGLAAALLVGNFLSGAMSAGDLASLLDQLPTGTGLGDTVTLVDGSEISLLDATGQAAMRAYMTQLGTAGRARPVTQAGPEYDYQRDKLGGTEYNVAPDGGKRTWADGLNDRRGSAQDAKYRDPGSGTSFYDPSSLRESLRRFAIDAMDDRLQKYLKAIRDPANPVRVLEIVTNDLNVARFIRERMIDLGVPGFIRVEI